MGTEHDVRAWLREHGTETIDHPGGTLYAHLGRVHDRLAALGADPDLRLAGLAHAAYGTDGFDVVLLDPADREPLRDLLGAPAEALVHLYGGCDRDRTWQTLAETGQIWSRFTGDGERPDPTTLRSFADLSIVNELDVVEHDPTIAARYGAWFRTVFRSWEPITSPPVTAEARRVLAG